MPAPKVTVIVPTRNNAATLDACLGSIRQQDLAVELIVVDNNSSDGTRGIAERWADQVFTLGPERSAQRNHGAAMAHGDYLLFIDSDMMLEPTVVSECLSLGETGALAVVVPEVSVGEGFWAACKALERSYYLGIDWLEAARFFARDTFGDLGGYDVNLTGPEDFDLPQRLIERSGRAVVGRCQAVIRHDEQRLSLRATLKKKHYYARNLDTYRSGSANGRQFAKQANPAWRYRLFFSHPSRLLEKPVIGAGMLFMKTAEFAAGGTGYLTRRKPSA